MREELMAAFAEGRGVTAKVRWISRGDDQGKNKWIHCTPLVGYQGQIGVWMVVVVDEEPSSERWPAGAGRLPPTVLTPEQPPTPGNGHAVLTPTRNGTVELNGAHSEQNGGDSMGSGSVTSLRIG